MRIRTGEKIGSLVSEPDCHYTTEKNPHKDVVWIARDDILEAIEELLESHREFDINQMICKPFSELDLLNLKNLLNTASNENKKEDD